MKIKSEMFEGSAKAHNQHKLILTIILFYVVFAIIALAEGIIPYIITADDVKQATSELDLVNFDMETIQKYIEISTAITTTTKVMIVSLFCTVFGTLISMFYCRCGEMRSLRSMGVTKKKCVPSYLIGLCVGALLMTLLVLVNVACGSYSISLCRNINFPIILLFAMGWFVQGMSEEFIFRGYLMNTIGGKYSPAVAVGISAAAFSLAHIQNPGFNAYVFLNLALFGVFAGLYMLLTDNIWGASAIHSIWNCLQGNFYGISVSGTGNYDSVFKTAQASKNKLLTGGEFGIEGSVFTTIILVAASVIVFMMIKKKNSAETAAAEA